jgi:hypothetical protein
MISAEERQVLVGFDESGLAAADLDSAEWRRADPVNVSTYWSGEAAPAGRHFEARLLWSETALLARFDAVQDEPLIVAEDPDLTAKTIGLWERDVCEIFVAPDPGERRRYFEFEAAPTGEWLDLAIDMTSGERVTDWEYASGMQTAANIEGGRVVIAIKVPWEAFGRMPMPGDRWLGNIFRCVGRGPGRGYLAWRPTFTEKPNFHVPDAFGELIFAKRSLRSEEVFVDEKYSPGKAK